MGGSACCSLSAPVPDLHVLQSRPKGGLGVIWKILHRIEWEVHVLLNAALPMEGGGWRNINVGEGLLCVLQQTAVRFIAFLASMGGCYICDRGTLGACCSGRGFRALQLCVAVRDFWQKALVVWRAIQ